MTDNTLDLNPLFSLINQQKWQQAHPIAVALAKAMPSNSEVWFALALINIGLGQLNKACKILAKAIKIKSKLEYYAQLAKIKSLQHDTQQVLAIAARYPPQHETDALSLDTIGVALSRLEKHQLAIDYYRQVQKLAPDNPQYLYNFGVSLKFFGLVDEARKILKKALLIDSDFALAQYALSDCGVNRTNNSISALKKSLKLSLAGSISRIHLGHALAKEAQDCGDFQLALTALNTAKEGLKKKYRYDFSTDQALFHQAEKLLKKPIAMTSASRGDRHIFIVGMPRSGTTLIDRILDNHEEVISAGEIQDFGIAVKKATGTTSPHLLDKETLAVCNSKEYAEIGENYEHRVQQYNYKEHIVTNKLPFNFFYTGIINSVLPAAKMIFMARNAKDTIIGNFRQLFSIGHPNYLYALSLEDCKNFHQAYITFAQLACQNNSQCLYVDYEDLVKKPEQITQKICTFLGIKYTPTLLDIDQNQHAVSTASALQTRYPINTHSIGRWRHFEKPMNDLFDNSE